MKLDRKALERLLSLSDAQLRTVLDKLAREYGLDLTPLSIGQGDLEGLRRALRAATDEELVALTRKLKGGK